MSKICRFFENFADFSGRGIVLSDEIWFVGIIFDLKRNRLKIFKFPIISELYLGSMFLSNDFYFGTFGCEYKAHLRQTFFKLTKGLNFRSVSNKVL